MEGDEDPFAYKDPKLDFRLDNDDKEEVNGTWPFQPGAASTPYYRGEPYEMQTMMPETSYEELPLLGTQCERQNSWDVLTVDFLGQAQ